MTPILSLTLAPPEDGHEGTGGVAQGLAHDGYLLLHEHTGVGGQIGRDAGGGGVGAVHGAEGVGDVDFSHGGELLRKLGVVLLLALVEAEVLKQHELARLQGGGLGAGVVADYILSHDDVHAQQLAQALGDRLQAQIGLPLSLGLAEVGAGDDGGAVLKQVLDGRQRGDYTLVAGNLAGLLVLRDVEVAAQQYFLSVGIEVVYGLLVVVHASFLLFHLAMI